MLTRELTEVLRQAVKAVTGQETEIVLDTPKHAEFGDYATPVAMGLGKKMGKNPREVAEALLKHIPENDLVAKVEIAGPGFLNITLSRAAVLREIAAFDPAASLMADQPKKITIDFGSPNIAKPLHFGNFRSLIIGESLARILRFAGHEVLADNFIGDWGTQFGKLIVAIRKWGDRADIDRNPIAELVRLYRRFHDEAKEDAALETQGAEEFRKLEQEKNAENFELWKWIVGESMKDFEKVAARLGAHYDVTRGESFYEPMLPEVLNKLEASGVARREAGQALVIEYPEEAKLPTMLFRKTDGATLYQTRDLAKIFFYDQEGFDKMVYVVGGDQNLHFRQVFAAAKMLGFSASFHHAQFGLVRLSEGKMSARSGRVVGIDEVLEEAVSRTTKMLEEHGSETSGKEREQLAETIAIGAIKFNDLGQNRKTDIVFEWEKMMDFTGYSGPFIQYSAVRCASILRKAGELSMTNDELQMEHPNELALAKKILRFPEIVSEAAEKLEPHHIAEYLFELAGEFNVFYANCPVLKAEGKEREARLFLTQKTAETLKQGLYLLGINTPERM